LLLGGVAGFLVIAKAYWRRLKTFFGRSSKNAAYDKDLRGNK
jgi:hypothetical protein